MTKEFALQQRIGDCSAIELYKLPFPAIRQKVQTAGDPLFASTTFADNQYRLVQWSNR